MTDAYRKAGVFVQNRFAGVLEETEEGYLFSYAKDYLDSTEAVAVSLTLPLDGTISFKCPVSFFRWFDSGRLVA